MRILLVEDEKKLAAFVKRGLEENCDSVVDVAYEGDAGLLYAQSYEYDAIILDIMLPRKDGLEVLKEVRARDIHAPVLLLTARDSVESKVKGLENGADDYLTKPFDLRELVARIRALLRRRREEPPVILTASDLTLDPMTRVVKRGKRELKLTAREFSLLEYLMRRKNRVLTRAQIVDYVWPGNFEGASNIVDVYVNYLRAKVRSGERTQADSDGLGCWLCPAGRRGRVIKSLKTRIAVWYVALSTAILIGFGAVVYLNLAHSLRQERMDIVTGYAERIRSFVAAQPWNKKEGFIHEFDEHFSLKLEHEYIQICTADGASLYLSPNLKLRPLPFKPELATEGPPKLQVAEAFAERQPVLMTVVPIQVKGETQLVTIAASLATVEETKRRLLLTLLLAVPVAILTALAGGAFLARRAIRPVDQMAAVAQQITAQSLNERIKLSHADIELERLAESFNQMITRLENSFRQVRQFTADASHELRTPLTILKGESQLALNSHLNPDEYKELLRSRMEELERMARIVDDLLILSRADSEAVELDFHMVDLSDLVIEACEQLRSYADAGRVNLVVEQVEPIEIRGDSLKLRQMLRNVLENAIKYTPESGDIRVQLKAQNDGHCLLTISDTGIGIPASDLPRVFDRFYRVDKARSRERGGSGLGLSIVKWVVEAHSGKILIESHLGEGTLVQIFFVVAQVTGEREEQVARLVGK